MVLVSEQKTRCCFPARGVNKSCCWQPVSVTASVQQQPPDVMRVLFKWSSNFQISSEEIQGKSYNFHKLILFIYLLTFGIGVFPVWCQILVMYWVERSRMKGVGLKKQLVVI